MKIIDVMRKIIQIFVNICFVVLTIATLYGVLTRKLPGVQSAFWSMEVSRYSMISIVFFASAVNIKDKDEIVIEFFINRIRAAPKRILLIIGDLMVIFFLVIMIIYGFQMAINNMSQLSPSLGLPMTYVYATIPLGAILMMIEKIIVTMEHFKGIDI